MFYLVSERSSRKMENCSIPKLKADHILSIDNFIIKKIRGEWLIVSKNTGAWCIVSDAEYKVCCRIDNIRFSTLEIEYRKNLPAIRDLLYHLYKCGLLIITDSSISHIAEWRARPNTVKTAFSLTFLMSDTCNLSCQYCYLGMSRQKKPHILNEEVAKATIHFALQQDTCKIMIDFGEYSSAPRLFFSLIEYIEKIKHEYPTKEITLMIQTNGVRLTHNFLHFLKTHSFFVGVSLDGPEDIHDSMRKFCDGKGTYCKTMAGLKLVFQYSVPNIVLSTISRANWDKLPQILDLFLSCGINTYAFKPIIKRGTAKSKWVEIGINQRQYTHFIKDEFQYAHKKQNLDCLDENIIKFIFRALGDERGWNNHCPTGYCKFGENQLAVNSTGYVYPCPRFASVGLDQKVLGNLHSNYLDHFQGTLIKRLDPPTDPCSYCCWYHYCQGGCQLGSNIIPVNKRGVDPFCKVYAYIYHSIFKNIFMSIRNNQFKRSEKLGQLIVFDQKIF